MSQPAEPLVLVVRKTQASAFFGTHLGSVLTGRAIDTLIVTGCTTSGCVRASVVDAVSMNFRTVVASDAVGDRAHGPHEANLFDMGQKYADLLSVGEIMAALRSHTESVMAGAKSAQLFADFTRQRCADPGMPTSGSPCCREILQRPSEVLGAVATPDDDHDVVYALVLFGQYLR